MRDKRYFTLLIFVLTFTLLFPQLPVSAQAKQINIYVDDTLLVIPNDMGKVEISNGTTMIPLRAVSEGLGAKIEYDINTKTAIINGNIKVTVGSNIIVTHNGNVKIETNVYTDRVTGRMMVPLRVIAEVLNYNVNYITEDTALDVYISDNDQADNFIFNKNQDNVVNPLRSIVYGKEKFIAVGDDGTIRVSTDGLKWQIIDIKTNADLEKVIFNGDNFLVIGKRAINQDVEQFNIWTSSDGLSWTEQENKFPNYYDAIAANGLFMINTSGGDVYYSIDGKKWNNKFVCKQVITLDYLNNQFVIVGYDNLLNIEIYKSDDGITWNSQITDLTNYLTRNKLDDDKEYRIVQDIEWTGEEYVACGWQPYKESVGMILISKDLTHWQEVDSGINVPLKRIMRYHGIFVVVGAGLNGIGGIIATSADARAWNIVVDNDYAAFDISQGTDILFTATSNGILRSINGEKWNYVVKSDFLALQDVIWGNNEYVAVGLYGQIEKSKDGSNWRKIESGTDDYFISVAYGNKQYVAVGNPGLIMTSSNGEKWQKVTVKGLDMKSVDIYDVLFDGKKYIAVGKLGTIITSVDGMKWSIQKSGTNERLNSIAWNGSRFVVVGRNNTILTSKDGIKWEKCVLKTNSTYNNYSSIAWGNNKFVIVDENKGIAISNDGTSWVYNETGTNLTQGIYYLNGYFIRPLGLVFSSPGLIYVSRDGISWQEKNIGTSSSINSFTTNGRDIIAVGYNVILKGHIYDNP